MRRFAALEDLPFAVHSLARWRSMIFPSLLGGRAVSIVLQPLSKARSTTT